MKKRISAFLAIILVIGAVMGCSSSNSEESGGEKEKSDGEKMVLGIAVCDYTDMFHLAVHDAIKEECDKQGIELIATDAKSDVNTQINNVESLIEQGCQAIFISIVDSESGAVFKQLTEAAEIPLIAVNRGFEEADYFIGTDDVQAGEMEAEAVVKALGEKGNVCILQGQYGTEATSKRTEGNMNVLEQYPDIEVIKTEGGSWERAASMTTVENWVNSGDKIDAIIANSDEPAIGAILALEAAGYEKIPVAGIDANDDAITFINEGRMLASVSQSAEANGLKALEVALAVLDGSYDGEDTIYVDVNLVTEENVEEYLK